MDSNHRSRKTADLQSAPFGHSGICPNLCHYFRKRICDNFITKCAFLFLSLLSDSNQRPRDYKSRALANWAKEAVIVCSAVTVVKRVQMYGFFFNYKTFSTFFLKNPRFFVVFAPEQPFSQEELARKTHFRATANHPTGTGQSVPFEALFHTPCAWKTMQKHKIAYRRTSPEHKNAYST